MLVVSDMQAADEESREIIGRMARHNDVVAIAVGGEYGTLSEVGLALKMGRPVVSLGSWDLGDHVAVASTPGEAVGAAFGLLGV